MNLHTWKICSDYDHVLVDEFQDNNQARGDGKLMSKHLTSTCVVGDAIRRSSVFEEPT